MTLSELLKRAYLVGSQVSTAGIPIKDKDGKDVDIDFKIICVDDDSGQVSHIELIEK